MPAKKTRSADWEKYGRLVSLCSAYVAAENPSADHPEKIVDLVRPLMDQHADQEGLYVLCLDSDLRILAPPKLIHLGAHAACHCNAREILMHAFDMGAAKFVLIHNHPRSVDPRPSASDVRATHGVLLASRIMDIPLVEHIIVGRKGWYSMNTGDQLDFQTCELKEEYKKEETD